MAKRSRLGLYGGPRRPYGSFAGKIEPANPPTDDDADTVVTARLDRDGATVRPPRLTLRHAMDNARNSALVSPERAPLDAFEARFLRVARTPSLGLGLRVSLFSGRAADAFAPRLLDLTLDHAPASARIRAAETTSGTDKEAAYLAVPTVRALHAFDSQRNASLLPGPGTDRDAYHVILDVDRSRATGDALRVRIEGTGRAGEPFAPLALLLELDAAPEIPVRAAEV